MLVGQERGFTENLQNSTHFRKLLTHSTVRISKCRRLKLSSSGSNKNSGCRLDVSWQGFLMGGFLRRSDWFASEEASWGFRIWSPVNSIFLRQITFDVPAYSQYSL